MATTSRKAITQLCLTAQGDIGEMTTYTGTRTTAGRRIVFYLKAWLSDPTSIRQQNHRDRIRAAAAAWQRLCPCEKAKWMQATKKAGINFNGYCLFVANHMVPGYARYMDTIRRQTGINFQTTCTCDGPDTTPPSVPINLQGTYVMPHVALTWIASSDMGSGVMRYHVKRDGVVVNYPTSASFDDYDIVEGNTYQYSVAAEDNAGNVSAFCTPINVYCGTADTDPPSVPSGLEGNYVP